MGTQYKKCSTPVDSDFTSYGYTQYTVRTIPGWLHCLFGARSKTESVYVCEKVWLTEEGQPVSDSRQRKIQAAALFYRFGIENLNNGT